MTTGRGMFDRQGGAGVKVEDILYVPSRVDVADLSPDGSLLSADQRQQLEAALPGLKENRRYTKSELRELLGGDWPYGLIKQDANFYIVYKGVKHDRALGAGAHGKVKLVQHLADKKFYALKLQSDKEASDREFAILFKVRETPQTGPIMDRKTKAGDDQYLILMKLAPGMDFSKIVNAEIDGAYDDDDGNQIVEGVIPALLRLQLAFDALNRVDKLHLARYIMHRDLQPGNMVADVVNQTTRLIDYGLAIAMKQGDELKRSASERSLRGSTELHSPRLRRLLPVVKQAITENDERLMPDIEYNEATEMYAMGITFANFFHLESGEEEAPIVSDEYADAFLQFTHILPPEEYRSVLNLVRKMTDKDEKKVIKFADAMEEMKAIIDALKLKQPPLKAGIIDIAGSAEQGFLETTLASIGENEVGEVWLVDSSKSHRTSKVIVELKRLLEDQGLRVGDKYFAGQDRGALKQAVEDHLSKRPLSSSCVWVVPSQQLAEQAVITIGVALK